MISTTVLWLVVVLALTTFITILDAAPLVKNPSAAKSYLQKFNHMKTKNLKTGALATEDDFVAAIESFQAMAHLNITGELDNDTMEAMSLPRCGMPDDMGFSNSARKKRYAAEARWSKLDLTWNIVRRSSAFSPDLPDETIRTIMREALAVWSDVSQLSFQESTSSTADILIDFVQGSHGDGNPFDGPSGVLAHAFFPTQSTAPSLAGDAHFDEAETFTQLTSAGINLFQVAAHEFGHSLGLGHSDIPDALMAPFYRGYIPNFVLHEDDIAGIQQLYGENTGRPDMTMPPMVTEEGMGCPGMLDTIVRTNDKRTFAFKGGIVYQIDATAGVVDGFPKPISEVFPGLPDDIDAGFYYPQNGRTYFFKGNLYWRYRSTTQDSGYPRDISLWNGLPADIDSAFVWSGNGRVYFTKGNQYYRYSNGRIDSSYPRPLSVWGLPSDVDHIDAAQQWANGRTYFYVDDVYYRYNDQEFKPDDSYPRPTSYWWFGCGALEQQEQQIDTTTMSTGGSIAVSVPNKLALVLTAALALFHRL